MSLGEILFISKESLKSILKNFGKHKISNPVKSNLTPIDCGILIRSKLRNICAMAANVLYIDPEDIKMALWDGDWIIDMQEEVN